MLKTKFKLLFLGLTTAFISKSQCSVDIGVDTIYSNCGQQVYLAATALSDSAVLSSDFNGGQLGVGWTQSVNALYSNPCGPTLDGTPALWFGNVPAPRTVTTNGFDVSCGGLVSFDLDFAADDVPGSNCEDPDLPNEGVYFQYSINGGINWVDIFYFQPINGYANQYYNWANYSFPIPAAAMTTNTKFRWDQPVVSSAVNDHWGIDNVVITPAICGFSNFDWSNIPGTSNGFDQWVTPSVTTDYIIIFSDTLSSCSDTVTIVVPPTAAVATATSNDLVCPNCTDLDVQFTNYNAGSIVDDFDPSVNGTMWSDIQNGIASAGSCGSMSGNALYFDGAGDRWATTVPVDATASCGWMAFSLFLGNVGSGACNNVDAGEDVVIEYSVNGGASWTIINTYYQSQWDNNNSWQSYVLPIPPPAQTASTQFRWRQIAFTNSTGQDNWALDDVSFVCSPPPFDIVWTPSISLDNDTIQTPMACPLDTTMYTVSITDPATGCGAVATTTINVSCSCMFAGLSATVSTCEYGNSFSVSGDFVYIENPITGTIVVEVTNATGTYTQTIMGPFTDMTLTNYNVSGIIADGSPLTVNVYFSDDQTCSATLNDVSPVLPEVTGTSGSGVYCIGDLVSDIFVNVSGNGPYSIDYTIDGAPHTTNSALDSISLGNAPGAYVITNVSDSGCTNIALGNELIIVQNVPTVATIESGGVYCANESIANVFSTVTGTGPWDIYYTLDGTPLTVNSMQDTVILGNSPGVYEVIGITDAGCSNTASGTQTIVVHPQPIVDAGLDFTNCEGTPITLVGSGALSYLWNNGVVDGVAFIPTTSSTYTVVGQDLNGCLGIDSITVLHEPTPQPSFVADTTMGCPPMTVIFTNTTAGAMSNCEWTFGDGNSAIGCSDVSNVYLGGGNYDVTLDVTSINGCSNSVLYTDYIYVEPNPVSSYIPSLSSVITLNTEVSFTNTTVGAVNYMWDFGDGIDSVTVSNPTHNFPNDQTAGYIVTLYAYSPIGCVDSSYSIIQVNEEVIYYIPNTFTPDGDEFNQNFHPIFTSGFDLMDFNMKIYNRWGQVIFESNDVSMGWDGTYGGRNVQDGMYNWIIRCGDALSDNKYIFEGHVNVVR